MPESPQGIYAPLPQSLTDSESEEEIHNSNVNRKHHPSSLTNHNNQNGKLNDNHIIGDSTEIKMNFQNSHNSNNCEDENNVFIGVYSDQIDDNIAILQDIRKREPMSILRKCCFILSIQICILTVVVFIWVLPCSDDLSCPVNGALKTHKWIREYERIELKGMINIVDGIRGRSKNFVFMYRGDNIFNSADEFFPKRNGIICLVGGLGQVGWYDEMINEPSIIDCNLIDADHDGSLDCLVTDEYSQLGCINPISGQWLWHIHNPENSVKKGDLLDFPLVLPDLNGDGVNDLLLASSLGSKRHNNLIIISGANGKFIGKSYTLEDCAYIHKLQIDQKLTISFNCVSNDSELEKFKPLSELMSVITNRSQSLNLPSFILDQHKFYGQRKNTVNQRNIYSVSGKQLIVENQGKCPENCNVTVMLLDQKNGKDYMLSNATSMYGMVPTQLSFNKTNIDSKSAVHGFVIKFWEWDKNETLLNKDGHQLKREQEDQDKFNIFSNIMVRTKRMIISTNGSRKSRNIKENLTNNVFRMKMRLIKETIVLIVFNSTETRIVNTSQSNIVQFCRDGTENVGTICQPDLNYQENSLVVADLDNDGSQELVSYYTTFIKSEDSLNEWKLITYVQLLRLESELPQLYDTEIKN